MAKIIKKKFFEIDLPLVNEKYEALATSIDELNNKIVKIDATRKLKGKGVDIQFKIEVIDGKATALPKKITLLSSFIRHMMHKGISYVEDSITTETANSQVVIKPFIITRKKVSRAIRRTIRNSAKNWIIDYLKTKTDDELFQEILYNQLQKPLSLKLKKIYPLAICEIRIFEIKKVITKTAEKVEIKEKSEEAPKEESLEEEIVVEEKKVKKTKKKTEENKEN